MDLIAKIIQVTLDTLYDKGIIDIDDETEEFQTECEIAYDLTQPNGVTIVTMCGWYIFIWWIYYADRTRELESYHAQSMTLVECEGCGASVPESDLRDFHGKRLCDYCRWLGLPQRRKVEA